MTDINESWKQVVVDDIEYNYEISNFGNVRNKDKKVLKGNIRDGYKSATLCNNNQSKSFKIHRLVALMFIENNDSTNNIVNHIDGNKDNNHYTNLEWTTASANVQHAVDNKLIKITKRRVTQYDSEGNEIKIYESLDAAKKETGVDDGGIAKVCKGTRKTAGGFVWKYTDINDNEVNLDEENLEGYISVKDFPNYVINNQGKIYSKPYKKFLKSKITREGSEQVQVTHNNVRKTYIVHNLVADHFINKEDGKDFIIHLNYDKQDNCVSNLKRASLSELCYYNKNNR
jgi:hypothetical protein